MWYQNTRSPSFSFVTIHVWRTDGRTDGQTDGQNWESNTVRCIRCSRTVKNPCITPPSVRNQANRNGCLFGTKNILWTGVPRRWTNVCLIHICNVMRNVMCSFVTRKINSPQMRLSTYYCLCQFFGCLLQDGERLWIAASMERPHGTK